jgi:hypothetical protein
MFMMVYQSKLSPDSLLLVQWVRWVWCRFKGAAAAIVIVIFIHVSFSSLIHDVR